MLPGVHSLFTHVWTQPTCNRPSSERAIVIQRVLESWAVMAFSSSSMDPAQNRESQTETDWDIWKIHSLNYFGSKKYFLILKIGTSQAAQFKYLCAHGFAPLHGCTFSHHYSLLTLQGSYKDCEKLCGNVNCLFPKITCVRNKKLKWQFIFKNYAHHSFSTFWRGILQPFHSISLPVRT